jgi:agmatine deiminase
MPCSALVTCPGLVMITPPERSRVIAVAQADDAASDTPEYRMPAEWEPHAGTWLSWLHNRETWPGCFEEAQTAMVAAAAALAEGEPLRINVLDAQHQSIVGKLLDGRVPREQLNFHRIATNDAWIRDHGAIFVVRADADAGNTSGMRRALDFRFNAWGDKYPPFDLDDAVAERMAAALGVPRVRSEIVLEGGSIDVNGTGALLTTEQCLLNPNRNPGLVRSQVEEHLRCAFGVSAVIWLGAGIAGDDTDGHIDELTRFVAERTVVTAVETNADDPNYSALAANRSALESVRIDDRPLAVVELPMPTPLHYRGQRLPASYANFYVANEVVLVPRFDDPADAAAASILADCFPGRRVVGIDCRALVVGLGGLHCLTQQIPVAPDGLS